MIKLFCLLFLSFAAANPFLVSVATDHGQDCTVAPLISSSKSQVIPHSYIVKFKDHVTIEQAQTHYQWIHAYTYRA
jgi:hypothetical protein